MRIGCIAAMLYLQLATRPCQAGQSELGKCAQVSDDLFMPQCTLAMENTNNAETHCLEGGEVLRVVGDYKVFYIICISVHPLNFTYDGTLTPHAIATKRIIYFKTARNGVKSVDYETQVRVWSVSKLKKIFKAKRADHPPVPQNSRTGKFTLRGTGTFKDFSKSYYIFFEEPGLEPKLIRSSHTDRASYNPGDVCARVPCRSTHYGSNVTVEMPQDTVLMSQSEITGFRICGLSQRQDFRCHLQHNGSTDNWEITGGKDD